MPLAAGALFRTTPEILQFEKMLPGIEGALQTFASMDSFFIYPFHTLFMHYLWTIYGVSMEDERRMNEGFGGFRGLG